MDISGGSQCRINACIQVHNALLVNSQVLEEFYNIFGPELKSVTGDPKRIEDVVKRVDALVQPIEEVKHVNHDLLFSQSVARIGFVRMT